jgi:hypothetical protein
VAWTRPRTCHTRRVRRGGLAAILVPVLLAAGCSQAEHVRQGLGGAYDSAVDEGKRLRLPNAGDVGLDNLNRKAVHDELAGISALLPGGVDAKAVIDTACDAKTRYEHGIARTYDQAAAEALAAHGVDVSTAVIARVEQHLIHAAESSNPVPAAAAVFACRWAQGG